MDAGQQARGKAEVRDQGEVTMALDAARLRRAAVFIDYENVKSCNGRMLLPDEIIAAVRGDLAGFGAPSFVNVYLAVGLPESHAAVSNGLMYRVFKAGGTAVLCPSFRNGTDAPKNLADPTAIMDIGESLFAHPEIGWYALATGDKDFIPAVRKLHEYGKEVRLYYGDSLSAHLRDEVLLGLASEGPAEGRSAFSGVVSLSGALERNTCSISAVSGEAR
jgi:NYN domain